MSLIKRSQSVTADWQFTQPLIDGVTVKEMLRVPTRNGAVTEIFRQDWFAEPQTIGQVFQKLMFPGEISAWHKHQRTADRIFCSAGQILMVLYDGREDSPTYKNINKFIIGDNRPSLITIPSEVFHGVQNIFHQSSLLINIVDEAYNYEDPDHWELSNGSPEIPYIFEPSNR